MPALDTSFCYVWIFTFFYRPQTKFAKVMFLQVSVILSTGGGGMRGGYRGAACVVALGGACMVAPGGACVVAPGGHAWLLWGACVVAPGGGRAWFFRWDTVNERAVRILLECILVILEYSAFLCDLCHNIYCTVAVCGAFLQKEEQGDFFLLPEETDNTL